MTCWLRGRPRPPNSVGQPTHVQPSAPRRRSQARRSSKNDVLVTRAAPTPDLGELTVEQVVEVGPHLLAEGVLLGREAQVHGGAERTPDDPSGSTSGSPRA